MQLLVNSTCVEYVLLHGLQKNDNDIHACINGYVILYNYHHSTKLYRKISRVCCFLYCYECAARVTMPTATNE